MLKEMKLLYDAAEHDRWIRLDRDAFPISYRFKYCHHETGELSTRHGVARPHYFGEAFVVRHFVRIGLETFHERYQIQKKISNAKSPYYRCNKEIDGWLGPALKSEIAREGRRIEITLRDRGLDYWRFANPDVITYNPQASTWGFYEVKLPGDELRDNQSESLKVLQQVVPRSESAVVYLRPSENR